MKILEDEMTDSQQRTSGPLVLPDARLAELEKSEAVQALRRDLRQLPDIEPSPEVWQRIQARAAQGHAGGAPGRLAPFAMAAGLLLAVTAGLLGVNALRDGAAETELAARQVVSLESAEVRALRERSRQF